MDAPRCAWDQHAGFVVVFPPEDVQPRTPYPWHLVMCPAASSHRSTDDPDPGSDEHGEDEAVADCDVGVPHYAGVWGFPGYCAVVRAPSAGRFTLRFYGHGEDIGHLDNPRLACAQVEFDETVDLQVRETPQLRVETELFDYQRHPADREARIHRHYFPPQALPRDPMVALTDEKQKFRRKDLARDGEGIPVGVALTPMVGDLHGPTVDESSLVGDTIRVEIRELETDPASSLPVDADPDEWPLRLKGFERLRIPIAVIDLKEFGDQAERVSECFVFEHVQFNHSVDGAGPLRLRRGGELTRSGNGYALVHRWDEACPRDVIGVHFEGGRAVAGGGAGSDLVATHRLQLFDRVGPRHARPREFGNAEGGSATYLGPELAFHGGARGIGVSSRPDAGPGRPDRPDRPGEPITKAGWRWVERSPLVRGQGLDASAASACSAPLLFSYLSFLERVSTPSGDRRAVFSRVGIHPESFEAYCRSADSAWTLLMWRDLQQRLRKPLVREPLGVVANGPLAYFAEAIEQQGAALGEWLQRLPPSQQYHAWVMLLDGVTLHRLQGHGIRPDSRPASVKRVKDAIGYLGNAARMRRVRATLQDYGLGDELPPVIESVAQLDQVVAAVEHAERLLREERRNLGDLALYHEALESYLSALQSASRDRDTLGTLIDGLTEGLDEADPSGQREQLCDQVRYLLHRLQAATVEEQRIMDTANSRVMLLLLQRILGVSADLGGQAGPLFHWVAGVLREGRFEWSASRGDVLGADEFRAISHDLIAFEESIASLTEGNGYGLPEWQGPRLARHKSVKAVIVKACTEARDWARANGLERDSAGGSEAIIAHRVHDVIGRIEDQADWFAAGTVWRGVVDALRRLQQATPNRRLQRLAAQLSGPPTRWEAIGVAVEALALSSPPDAQGPVSSPVPSPAPADGAPSAPLPAVEEPWTKRA